ncbi:hypothetical protein HAX54_053126, partial [Datura stramonium]|nr:hypothetical protein [Datura stramonium]
KEVDTVSIQEEIKEIGMAQTTNPKGEPGTWDEGTQNEHVNTSMAGTIEQGIRSDT